MQPGGKKRVSHDATRMTGFKLRPFRMYSHNLSSSYFTSPRLQAHDKLLYTRHPKRDILSARSCEHVDVDGKRELAIVACHRCATSQHPTYYTSVEK
jgi:hypothetical protein